MGVDLHSALKICDGTAEPEQLGDVIRTEMPLRRTLQWVAKLPDEVRPSALMYHNTRVTNVIAATWEDPKAFRDYMKSLFTSMAANRRAFPLDVLNELIGLQRYFDQVASVQ